VSAIPADAAAGRKPKFLEQLRTFMRARRYSRRTEQAYVDWVRRFILFHSKRHPRELGHVKASLTCQGGPESISALRLRSALDR
jgi:Phage integrase, N-terminal SAM-like domain